MPTPDAIQDAVAIGLLGTENAVYSCGSVRNAHPFNASKIGQSDMAQAGLAKYILMPNLTGHGSYTVLAPLI